MMAELLLPLKVDVPTSISKGCHSELESLFGGWPERLKTIEVFKVIEYDTHQKVILWRSRVGNRLRPKVCMCVLHYCKRVVLEFSMGFTSGMRVSEGPGLWPGFPEQGLKVPQRVSTTEVSRQRVTS